MLLLLFAQNEDDDHHHHYHHPIERRAAELERDDAIQKKKPSRLYLRDWRAPGVQHHLLRLLLLFVSQHTHRRRRIIISHDDGTPVSRDVTAERDRRHADAAQDKVARGRQLVRLCRRRRRPFPVLRRGSVYGRQQRARLRVKKTLGFFDVVV